MGLKKKMKKEMSGVQPKWRSWMTVASVFGGVTLVSGATVLGLFLTGRFDEKHITPEDIAFYYEENYNDVYSQLEVCDDFYLTINTTTEEVTETTVELSFADESNDVTVVDEYISNTIIKMPRFVEIGKPFPITLVEEEISFGAETIDWIKGGVSIIKAKSEYNMLSPISLQVAVDVPVWKIETEIVDKNGDPLGNNVIRGEDFKMKTTFYPAKSQYMYSDDSAINNIAEENKRTKDVFYMATGANGNKVSPHYDDKHTMHYTASDNNVDSDLTIKSYVFTNAIDQINYEESISQIADSSEYYSSMVSYIASGTKAFEDAENDIKISTASIDSFRIITNNIDPLYTGRMLTLYAGAGDGKSNTRGLGSIITAKNGSYIYNNFKYIAVRFTTGSGITISAATEIEVGGEVYYLPNTEVDDINLAYWEIYSEVVQSAKMEVVLIDQNEDGEYIIWNDIRHTVDFSISEKQEVAPAWNSTEAVNITLSVLPSGGYGSYNIDLSSRRVVDNENTYTDTIYFVEYDEETNGKLLSEVIENQYLPAVEYSFSGSTTKKLFALVGENLTVKDNASLKVYIATVKSKVANAGVYDISLWCDSPLTVKCVKALSEASVENYSIVKISNAIESKTETMIYRSEANAQFLITFKVRDDAFEVFQTEFYKKKDLMVLSIFNKNGTNITGYFTIDGEAQIDLTNNTISFVVTLNNTAEIETDDGEKESTSVLDQCVLTFNQEGKDPIVWEKVRVVKDTDYSIEEYKVYKPVASSIAFIDGEAISSVESQIKQELDENGESKITIDGADANYTQFIETLLGTNGSKLVVTDQHNDTNSLLGKWKLAIEEGSTKAISLTSTRKSFTLGTTEKTDVTETAILTVWSDDDRVSIADFTITLNITSTGIVKAEGYTDILEEDGGVNKIQSAQKKAEESTTEVSVEIYGIAEREVSLSDLFKLYVAYTDETTNTALESGYTVKIDSSYWGALTSDVINALKGMISFIDETDSPISSIENVDIRKIKFNKPFGAERTLKFIISNANGAVNTTLNVKIMPAITYAGQTSIAGVANTGIPLDNVVYYKEYKTLSSAPQIEKVPTDKTYFVNQQTNNVCIIEENSSASTVARIVDGKIYFNDFYIDYSKEFKIQFSPDGNNSYALNQIVSFEVTRNLNLPREANVYYLYNAADGSAISGKRISDILGDGVGSVDGLTYYFDKYLEVDASNNQLSLNIEDKLIFAYNQKYIETTLKIQHNGNYIKDENGDDLVYTIKLALPEQSYKFMQNYFATGEKPISQVVNGVEYLVFDKESVGMSTETFPLQLTQKDENSNSMGNEYIVIVEDTGTVTTTTLSFRNTNNNIAYEGVGDVASKIVLYSQEHLNVYIHVPVIIAHQGFETIVYEGMDDNYYYTRNGEKYSMIEVALSNETFLQENGFFKEIVGGSVEEILNATSGAGLYGIGKITNDGDAVVKEIKNLEGEDRENRISLYNLAVQEQYIILNYELGGTILKYNVKVTQNVQGQIVYPYETSPEYIIMPTFTEVEFDINEAFNNDTLNPNEFRFNVTDMMGTTFTGLTASTEIQLVKVEGISAEGFTSPTAWENYVIIEEANATDGLYTFTVKGNKDTGVNYIIEVKFKRTYKEIVGLEQIYTLRINDIKNYSIQMSEDSAQGGVFTQTGEADCEYTVQHTAGKELNFKVLLIENADAGQGTAGTEVYHKLNIKCPEQPDIVTSVYYDNSNGTFKVTLGDYLATQDSVRFVAYTEYGVAGTIDIVLKPTYMVEKAESYQTQLNAGESIALSSMFNVNEIALSQTCTSVEGSPLVKLAGQSLQVFDLYKDEDITLTFTFNDGTNDFVFTTSYTLKANLTISSATGVAVSGDEVYTVDSDFIKMFVKENGTGFSENISIKSISSVSTDNKFYDVGAESTPNIVVTLEYKDGETTLWTIDVNYVVTVYPAVTMTPSYPEDIEGGKLSVEYVESGAAINFSENHLLAADPRAYIRMNSISGSSLNIDDDAITDSTDIKYSDVTIKINSIQNAIVEVDGNKYTRTGYTSEGVVENLYTNLIIDSLNEGITLTTDGSSVGNGKALVSFQIECRGVTLTYDVEIQKNVYTIGTHTVELNMADGVETIYIDQVDKEDLFAKNRMLEAKLKDSIPASQELIMIFNKGTEGAPEYYASASLYINKDHAGQTLTYDLGYDFELTNEDQIVALIPASVIVQKDSGLSIDTDNARDTFRQFTGENLTQALLNSYPVGNYIESFKLTHRVEVLYSGISVDYDKFNEVISSTTLPSATVGGESADVTFIFNEFKIMNAESLRTTYKFKYAIDIAMDTSDLMVTVEVGQEDIAGVGMNAINLLGIKHPSTGALLSAVDFQTKSPILKFEVLNPNESTPDAKFDDLKTKLGIKDEFSYYTETGKQPYLAYISVEDTESGKIVNHALSAMGAKNTGNYVLVKFTYKIGSEEQSFYAVVKVVPDYTIKFGGAVVNLGNENNEQVLTSDAISNSTIITFQDLVGVSGTNYYTGVTNNGSYLTSTADTNGYLSIVHSNSSNKPEISTTNFTITLPVGGTNDSGYEGFNNGDNINNKFDREKIGDNNWTVSPESGEITSISAKDKSKPVGVQKLFKQAVFANQDFYIEGKDIYGFTYRVRFRLVADSTPYVAEDAIVELTEGKSLDFAAQYSLIDVYDTTTQKEGKNILAYSTSQKAPTEGADAIVEFRGIAVNMFQIDDGENFLGENLTLTTGTDYLDEDDAIENMIDAKVAATKIQHITVTGVELKDVGGQEIATIKKPDTDQTLATSEAYYYASGTAGRKAAGKYQVNWTPYKHLFGTGTTISDLKLVVTLKYDDGSNIENAVVTVNNVKLNRGINTTQVLTPVENRTVYDGVSFDVKNHFENAADDGIFYQDTLEVVVPAGESTTFVVINRDNDIEEEKTITNIGNQKGKTFRYSISEMFNTNDIVGKGFKVAADNENVKFYYNNQNIENESTFTLSEIEDYAMRSGDKSSPSESSLGRDRIYLDDSTKGTARTEITKYYLYKKDESTKYYRLERTYHVYPEFTGVKMEDDYSTEGMIIRALKAGDSTSLNLCVDGPDEWSNAYAYTDSLYIGGSLTKDSASGDKYVCDGIKVLTFENNHRTPYSWLKYRVYFEIKKDETSAYGKAKLISDSSNDYRSESTIEIDDDFGDNEFILLNVYVVISGSDRVHSTVTGQYEKVLLTTLKLGKIL